MGSNAELISNSMVAGLTPGEELDLAMAENERCRAAIEIAIRGLSAARDQGFQDASEVIADVNAALAQITPPPPPLWPQLVAWAKSLSGMVMGRAKQS
jgi:hypothetical protein